MPIVIHTTRTPTEKRAIPMFNGTYDAPELRPFDGRRSAMQASALPSRRDNLLRWPADGRLTTLDGTIATEKDHAATLPAFPVRMRSGSKQTATASNRGPNLENWGERKSRAKLDATKVREIRAKYAAGTGPLEISKSYDVHVETIKMIVSRQTWKDVT